MSLWLFGQFCVIRFIDLHSWLWHFEPITKLTKSGEAHDISVWTYTCFFVEKSNQLWDTIIKSRSKQKKKQPHSRWVSLPGFLSEVAKRPKAKYFSQLQASCCSISCWLPQSIKYLWSSTLNLLLVLIFQFRLGYQNNKRWESDEDTWPHQQKDKDMHWTRLASDQC